MSDEQTLASRMAPTTPSSTYVKGRHKLTTKNSVYSPKSLLVSSFLMSQMVVKRNPPLEGAPGGVHHSSGLSPRISWTLLHTPRL